MNKEIKKKIKMALTGLFVLYIFALVYFLFFAERVVWMNFEEREYRYNLVLFQEIKRFWIYREQLGFWAVATNLFGNVLGFVPFGMILPMIHKNTRGFFFITLSGFTLSLGVEIVQLITKRGCFDVDDLVLNTLGTAIGYLCFAVTHLIYTNIKEKRRTQDGEEEI